MLSVVYGVSAMIPLTFGISGYVLVSRDGARPNPSAAPQPSITTILTNQRAKAIGTLSNRKDKLS
jgi:hypothetical protein